MLAIARRLSEGERIVRAGEWRTWEPVVPARPRPARSDGRDRRRRADRHAPSPAGWRASTARCCSPARRPRRARARARARPTSSASTAPLTAETRGLIGEPELRAMKPTAYLVNTARGPIVDTAALERALREGWIAGAALDVTDPEPLPGDHPLLGGAEPARRPPPRLGHPPHPRGDGATSRSTTCSPALAGERMPHCVNPEVYELARPRPFSRSSASAASVFSSSPGPHPLEHLRRSSRTGSARTRRPGCGCPTGSRKSSPRPGTISAPASVERLPARPRGRRRRGRSGGRRRRAARGPPTSAMN